MTCAIKVQEGLAGQESITLRVGVHMGDITHEEEDIFGDGVNIASRLQEIARPGGIVISDIARRSIDGKLAANFVDLGVQGLKNIVEPITVYGWGMTEAATKVANLPLPDKPSIAVLPFDNMSGDPEQEYFADGITEDITTNLSRIRWLFVIARNSSFVFKGQAIDVRQISRELGVRYLLEGSVRKAANRVRITAQLIDAQTSNHIWAERYDRELTDLFAVQDEITEKVAGAIEPAIFAAEGLRVRDRSSSDLGAWELLIRAVSAFWRFSEEDIAKAITLLETATERYPQYAPAHSMLAFALLFAAQMGWRELSSIREKAELLAEKAFNLDDQDAWAHVVLGYMQTMNRNTELAVQEFSRAIDLNPNFASAYGWRGLAKAHAEMSSEAIEDANIGLRLSPKDPQNIIFHAAIALAHFLAGRYDESINSAKEVVRQRPGYLAGYRMQCTALARSGRTAEAQTCLKRLLELQPNLSASLLRRTLPYPSSDHLEQFVGGLVIAGLPEE